MRRAKVTLFSLLSLLCFTAMGDSSNSSEIIIPDRYTLDNKIYRNGWIDFNKNGRMDVYEDPNAGIEERIADLISQMTLEEKTNQMVTLYGYGRVLEDDLPMPEWKNRLWKDSIWAIDEHLNEVQHFFYRRYPPGNAGGFHERGYPGRGEL